jgi:hypothetical protein
MGGFSSQVQPAQSSAPAGKNAGLSSGQLGQNPIYQSPQDQMMKMQELQMEQPDFSMANQITNNGEAGTQIGGLGGLLGGKTTMSGLSGQPKLGMPNAYSNTMQPWDNQPNQSNGIGFQPFKMTGKGA